MLQCRLLLAETQRTVQQQRFGLALSVVDRRLPGAFRFTDRSGHRAFGKIDLLLFLAFRLCDQRALPVDERDAEVVVTSGTSPAMLLLFAALLDPGDEVLIPDPTWVTHVNLAMMLRASVKRVPAPAEDGFVPTMDAWEKAVSPKSRAIVVNFPSSYTANPPNRVPIQTLPSLSSVIDRMLLSGSPFFVVKCMTLSSCELP